MTSPDAQNEPAPGLRPEELALLDELQALVSAGLLVEVLTPGESSRYALTAVGRKAGRQGSSPQEFRSEPSPDDFLSTTHHEFSVDGPEPCPACRARDGFDGGGRCRRCRIAWSPDM